ncbi:MAG: endonuclease IV [Candidatus Aenigmatarchaeota archaeon]|nr:MAG: endonuclease IV [Candidatus Aenigmarchaeota archaeon]
MVKAKIRLGPAGSGGYSSGTLDGVSKLPELGLNALEVEFVRGVAMGNDLAKKVGEEAKKQDVMLSVHAPYYINLASKEPEKIEQSKKRILDSCERMHYMGGGPVVFHPSYFGGMDKNHVFEITKEAINDMLAAIKEKKWNCQLAPETTGKHSALGSLEETIMLSNETGCSMCIDFAHLFARNSGQLDYGKVLDKVEPLGLKHLHTHFSGINYTEKGERNHITIAHGSPRFKPLAEEILGRGLDITIISESPVTWQDSMKMRKVFEDLGYKF